MYQNWRRLLFLHWAWDAPVIRATLPEGLTVDTWDGKAWLGVIPFKMEGVRPRFCPSLPWISNFPELNVRTYVRDRHGRPGIWFYSLDCAQPLAVWTARCFFALPYFQARMSEEPGARIDYRCQRNGAGKEGRFQYQGIGEPRRSEQGTIEQFLIERYRLFAARGKKLFAGEVWHEPYPLQQANVEEWSLEPLQQAGFFAANLQPDHAIFSPGVDTCIYGIEPV
jgi:uncharacterized protein YqjF (DUF2071 family)